MRTFVILNPTAGGAEAAEELLARELAALDDLQIGRTTAAGDAQRLAARARRDGFERVVAAGGDGTLNEVLNGLAPDFDGLEVGLVPLGTGNDLARTLEIPRTVEEAVAVLVAGVTRRFDVARVEGETVRYFLNVSAGGFSGEVGEILEQDPEVKAAWGPLSYVRGAFQALSQLEPYRTRLVIDPGGAGEEELRLASVNVIVANARFVGGGLHVAPPALPDDGLLDLIVVRAAPVGRLSVLASKVLVSQHMEDELILHRQVRRLEVHAEPSMPFNADGELIGHTPVRYEVLPQALRLVVPAL